MAEFSELLQRQHVVSLQEIVGTRCDSDGVFGIVADADKGRARRLACDPLDVQAHTGRIQRRFQWNGKSVITQRNDHGGSDPARARAGDGLIGTLAAGEGFEVAAQHGLARCGNVRCTHHKIKIGRAGNKNHGVLLNSA